MEISSLARSFPGHSLLPAPNGRNVPAFGVKFCTNFNSSEAVSRTEFLPWKKPISPVLFSRFVRCLPSGEEGANLSDKQIAKAYRKLWRKLQKFRAKHKRKQEEELASMNAKKTCRRCYSHRRVWKEENEDGPWKSLERFQAYEDLVLGNMRRAAESKRWHKEVLMAMEIEKEE
nr:flagellar attachment zone protein 1-like [Ipomoea batatas]